MTELEKKVAEIETGLQNTPLPEKFEFMNFPIWETVYKSYRMEKEVLLPNREAGIDFLNSKVLNIPVKYIGLGLLALRLVYKNDFKKIISRM